MNRLKALVTDFVFGTLTVLVVGTCNLIGMRMEEV